MINHFSCTIKYFHVFTNGSNIHVLVLWEEPANSVVVELNPRPSRALSVSSPGRNTFTMSKGLMSCLRWDSPLGRASRMSLRARSAFSRLYAALEELCDGSCPGFRLFRSINDQSARPQRAFKSPFSESDTGAPHL